MRSNGQTCWTWMWSFVEAMPKGLAMLLAAATLVGFVVPPTADPKRPALHRRVPHPDVQRGATFFWTGDFGNVDNPLLDALDDLVGSSIDYDYVDSPTQTWENLGPAYAYSGADLAAHPSNPQLLPKPPYENFLQMGQLAVVIGDLRGTAASPQTGLVCLGAALNDGDLPGDCPPGTPQNLGSVEIFDLTIPGAPPFSLLPPVPCSSGGMDFGYGLAIADVDGDGIKDLVVGAPTAPTANGQLGWVLRLLRTVRVLPAGAGVVGPLPGMDGLPVARGPGRLGAVRVVGVGRGPGRGPHGGDHRRGAVQGASHGPRQGLHLRG